MVFKREIQVKPDKILFYISLVNASFILADNFKRRYEIYQINKSKKTRKIGFGK